MLIGSDMVSWCGDASRQQMGSLSGRVTVKEESAYLMLAWQVDDPAEGVSKTRGNIKLGGEQMSVMAAC